MPEAHGGGIIPKNRIYDCWMCVFEGESVDFASCTPLSAALEVAKVDGRASGRRVRILPMPEPGKPHA